MSQSAQQDHLIVEDKGHIAGLQQETKNKLKLYCRTGQILDVILKHSEGEHQVNYSKVLGYEANITSPEKPTFKVILVNTNTGALHTLSLG